MKKVDNKMKRMGRQFQDVGKRLSTTFTVPILAAGGTVIKFGADFEQAMVQSTAIMGDLSDAMRNSMEQAARDVAKTTKFSATEAAEAFEFLALAGLDAEQSMAALPQVAAFAQAGNFDLARATDLATDAQAALGLASKDAQENLRNMTRVTDVLTKAATSANASTEQFSVALTEKAGVALRNLGKDIEEGAAALSVFADQGVKGGAAGTALNATLEGLSRNAIVNSDAFKDLGVQVFDADGNMNNLADIVGDLEGALGNMSAEQQRATLMKLGFNRQALNGIQMLMGNSDAMRELEGTYREAAGTVQDVADKQLQNFWDQLGLVKDQLVDVALTVYKSLEPVLTDTLIPALQSMGEWLGRIGDWFADLDPKWQTVILGAVGFVAALGPLLLMIGIMLPALGAIGTALGMVSGAFAALLSPVGLVIAAIAAAIAIGWLIYSNWDTIVGFLEGLWQGFADWFTGFWGTITTFISGVWDSIKQTAENAWNGIRDWLAEWWEALLFFLLPGIGALVLLIVKNWDKITEFTRTAWEAIKQFFVDIWEAVKGVFGPPIEWIVTTLSTAWDTITGTIRETWDNIKRFLSDTWDGIKRMFDSAFGDMVRAALDFGKRIMESLKQGIGSIKLPIPTFGIEWREGPLGVKLPDISIGVNWRALSDLVPFLADGGIVTKPTLAVIGEAGPEAVIPLSRGGLAAAGMGAPAIDYDRLAAAVARHMQPVNIYTNDNAKAIRRELELFQREQALEWGLT